MIRRLSFPLRSRDASDASGDSEPAASDVPPRSEVYGFLRIGSRNATEEASATPWSEGLAVRPAVEAARELGRILADHVRFEERTVFPHLERTLPADRLAAIDARLDRGEA
jgi:hypothetical protein